MAEAELEEVKMYVACLQKTVAPFIKTRYIMDMCQATELCPGVQVYQRLWEQESLYPEEMWEAERAAEMTGKEKEEDGD